MSVVRDWPASSEKEHEEDDINFVIGLTSDLRFNKLPVHCIKGNLRHRVITRLAQIGTAHPVKALILSAAGHLADGKDELACCFLGAALNHTKTRLSLEDKRKKLKVRKR